MLFFKNLLPYSPRSYRRQRAPETCRADFQPKVLLHTWGRRIIVEIPRFLIAIEVKTSTTYTLAPGQRLSMSPIHIVPSAQLAKPNGSHFVAATKDLRQQWMQSRDVISVLLLLGGEIVNKALAQLAGGVLTPVTFSFGITPRFIVVGSASALLC